MTISYAVTACNEHVELERLLDQLNSFISSEDEIVVQLDTTATTEVKKVAEKYNLSTPYEYHRIIYSLNNDFAAFKNNLKDHCTRDYIFFLDADEYIGHGLLTYLKNILRDNPKVDCYAIPRVNTVEGIQPDHVKKWGWQLNNVGWINYPDYQTRICKNDKSIVWSGKVHEKLVGWKVGAHIPQEEPDYALQHHKTIERQEKQNNYYSTL